jgi:hypothetical protein
MFNNCEIFCGVVTETTRAKYDEIMGQDGMYGGYAEVVVICEIYKVTVAIHSC